jgi:hypothetical protein
MKSQPEPDCLPLMICARPMRLCVLTSFPNSLKAELSSLKAELDLLRIELMSV